MNIWKNTILTEKGQALMSKLTQGVSLEITRAVTGAGFVTPGMLLKVTDVTAPKQELTFRPVSYPETGKCAITVALKNDGLGNGYTATQVGLFATDPDEGEILLFISQSTEANTGTNIPSETEMPGFSSEWTFYLQYGQANGVTVVVDPSNAVTQAVMEEYVAESLKTMEDDIDMGGHKITNVAEPTQGSDVATRHFVEQHTLEGNLYVAMDYNNDGNVVLKPYVADEDEVIFKAHLENKNNPHGATWQQVGAAPGGFGLGGLCTVVTDWNTATANGFYWNTTDNNHENDPFPGMAAWGYTVVPLAGDATTQVAFTYTSPGLQHGMYQKIRYYKAVTGWSAWEWVNPPMEVGVEYRTTERFNGKPVYTKLVHTEPLGNGITKNFTLAEGSVNVVEVKGFLTRNTDGGYFPLPCYSQSGTISAFMYAAYMVGNAHATVNIISTTDMTNYTAYITVKYTKNTTT